MPSTGLKGPCIRVHFKPFLFICCGGVHTATIHPHASIATVHSALFLKLTLCQVSITLHSQFTIYWPHKGSIPGRQSYKLRECKTLTTKPYWHALACHGAYPITVLYHIPRLGFIQSTSMAQGHSVTSMMAPQQPTPSPLGGAGGGLSSPQ